MKKLDIFAGIGAIAILYLLNSLCFWNFNPGDWHIAGRIILAAAIFGIIYRLLNPKEEEEVNTPISRYVINEFVIALNKMGIKKANEFTNFLFKNNIKTDAETYTIIRRFNETGLLLTDKESNL